MGLLGGVDGSLRVGADDLDLRVALLQVAARARDRAARADRDHERVDLTARLLPDLRACRLVVGLGIGHVRVLVGLEAAGDLLREPVRDRVVALGRVVLDGGRRDHDLGAVGPQHRDLLLAHLVRHHEDAAVAARCRRDREPDAGVARGRLDDRPAGPELPLALGRLDHRHPDPVLVRAAGVQVLELGEQGRLDIARDPFEPDDRGMADQVEQRWVLAGHRRVSLRNPYSPAAAISGRTDGVRRGPTHPPDMTSRVTPKQCRLREAVGERELCPGETCVFWEGGGAVVEPGCAIERLGVPVARRPDLARPPARPPPSRRDGAGGRRAAGRAPTLRRAAEPQPGVAPSPRRGTGEDWMIDVVVWP